MLAVVLASWRLRRAARARPPLCRTCLRRDDLSPIFTDARPRRLARQLNVVTGLVVTKDDGLPQTICSTCRTAIRDAYKFRRKSLKANETLRSMGNKTAQLLTKSNITLPSNTFPNSNESGSRVDGYNSNDNNEDGNDISLTNNHNQKSATQEKATPAPMKRDKVKSTPGKPFKCKTCSKEFRMKNTYLAHVRSHTNFFICELCGKQCRSNTLLQLHRRGRHALDRVHACALCPYTAASREGLVNHARRHTGERPFCCDTCGASFGRRSSLLQHLPVHLPERRFQCPVCARRFQSKKFLASHALKTHAARRHRYLCPACPRGFSSPDAARKHLARAHHVPRHAQGPVARVPAAAR